VILQGSWSGEAVREQAQAQVQALELEVELELAVARTRRMDRTSVRIHQRAQVRVQARVQARKVEVPVRVLSVLFGTWLINIR
jgi:hypothetical protein